jgi:hypothetical protein
MKGPDVTVYLDRDYLAKAISFGLHRISTGDSVSPLQFSRGGDLMIVMPVRAIAPDHIERPRLVPAVEQFASPPVPVPKPVAPAAPQPPHAADTRADEEGPEQGSSRRGPPSGRRSRRGPPHGTRTLKGVRRSLHMPPAPSAARPSASWAVSADCSGSCNVAGKRSQESLLTDPPQVRTPNQPAAQPPARVPCPTDKEPGPFTFKTSPPQNLNP